jgi:hypothetical protein
MLCRGQLGTYAQAENFASTAGGFESEQSWCIGPPLSGRGKN